MQDFHYVVATLDGWVHVGIEYNGQQMHLQLTPDVAQELGMKIYEKGMNAPRELREKIGTFDANIQQAFINEANEKFAEAAAEDRKRLWQARMAPKKVEPIRELKTKIQALSDENENSIHEEIDKL